MDVTFDPVAFRDTYTQFSNEACFSNMCLTGFWDTATQIITPTIGAMWNITQSQQTLICNLATAHIAAVFDSIGSRNRSAWCPTRALIKLQLPSKHLRSKTARNSNGGLGSHPTGK